MELDLTGIHKLAAEQGIDPGTLDDALAEALRLAYLKTPHAAKHAYTAFQLGYPATDAALFE